MQNNVIKREIKIVCWQALSESLVVKMIKTTPFSAFQGFSVICVASILKTTTQDICSCDFSIIFAL
jgi:hypothetical protein